MKTVTVSGLLLSLSRNNNKQVRKTSNRNRIQTWQWMAAVWLFIWAPACLWAYPKANFTYYQAYKCVDTAAHVKFTDSSYIVGSGSITGWLWKANGQTSTKQNPDFSFADTGVYQVTLIVTADSFSKDSIKKYITVYKAPKVKFDISGICDPYHNVTFTDKTVLGTGVKATGYSWNFDDGNSGSGQTITHSYSSAPASGYWTVSLTVTTSTGCKRPGTQRLVAPPKAYLYFASSCDSAHTVSFSDSEFVASPQTITNRRWYFGDGDSSDLASPVHSYSSSGTYKVSVKVTTSAGCSASYTSTVDQASFPDSVIWADQGCGYIALYDSLGSGSHGKRSAGTTLKWYFGDGNTSTDKNPVHHYAKSGTYTYTLLLSHGSCSKSITGSLTVSPSAYIGGFIKAIQTCVADSVSFIDSSYVQYAKSPYTTMIDFGDGATLKNPGSKYGHMYKKSGTYTITRSVKDVTGCSYAYTETVHAGKTVIPGFKPFSACAGQKNIFIQQSADSNGSIINTYWNFGDKTGYDSFPGHDTVSHIYANPGVYTVTIKVIDNHGCIANTNKTVSANGPSASFVMSSNCLDGSSVFGNTSTDSSGTIKTIGWDFGDGDNTAVQKSGKYLHHYKTSGSFIVTLTVADAVCSAQVSKTLKINVPEPFISAPSLNCLADSVKFKGKDKNGGTGLKYFWKFGNGAKDSSSLQNPAWLYKKGGFEKTMLTLTDSKGCQNTDSSVTFTDSNCVWPGDADYNKKVDIYDALPLGIAFGDSGALRPSASTSWNAQPCYDWTNSFKSGLNHKHADCNGDGKVTLTDFAAILKNAGKTHPKAGAGANKGNASDPPLYITFSKDSSSAGDTVTAAISLGSSSIKAKNIYGIAFGVDYGSQSLKPKSITADFSNSWIGTLNKDMAAVTLNDSDNGIYYIALTRIDHKSVSGMGEIGTLSIVMPDNLAGKRTLTGHMKLYFTGCKAQDETETGILLNPSEDSLLVYESTGVETAFLPGNISMKLFPNPAKDVVKIRVNGTSPQYLSITDMQGRVLMSKVLKENEINIETGSWPSGIYIAKVQTAAGIITARFMKEQ